MFSFKICPYKVLLTLSLGLTAHFLWGQEDSITQTIDQEVSDTTSQQTSNNDNINPLADIVFVIFDPVLIQSIALEETDENRELEFGTIELSSLPSTSNSSSSNNLDSSQVNLDLLDSSLVQFQESILQFELEGGVYDYRLSELYLGIGNTYQQLDESQLAIEAFSEALQLRRINDGLLTEDQIPIVEELVESYLNMGDIASANLNQEYLLYLNQKIYGAGHPIILSALLEYADWNLYAASLSLDYRPNLESLHFRTDAFNEDNFIQSEEVVTLLSAATFAYSQAVMIQHDLEARINEVSSSAQSIELKDSLNFSEEDFDIPDVEQKLAYTYFLQYQFDQNNIDATSFDAEPNNYFRNSYINGRDALISRHEYLIESDSSPLDISLALLDIADWFLVFNMRNNAKQNYIQAFNFMESNGIEQVNGFIYPDLPSHIPNFLSHPYTRAINGISSREVLDYEGYIDISFELNRSGRPSSIRVTSRSEGTNDETERALVRNLRLSTYRLQVKNQTEYSENSYLVRYYYTTQLPEE